MTSRQMETRQEAHARYGRILAKAGEAGKEKAALRELARHDLFFLLCYLLNRRIGEGSVDRDWVYDRCREVQADPDGRLDLWARFHFKSTIITFGKTIQDILRDPEITVAIFSWTRPLAKDPLIQIKREFESNNKLRHLFPDILWDNP